MENISSWRLKNQRLKLSGEACDNCGEKIFPPRDICPGCGKRAITPYIFSGRGEVYSFTKLYEAPAGYEKFVPITIALIKLAEGPMITAQLTDLDPGETVAIGDQVEMVTRLLKEDGERGILVYGPEFRKLLRQGES